MALRYVDPNVRRGPMYRAYAWLSATRLVGWFSRHVGWKLDPLLMRLTRGRLGVGLMLPTALLETRGARTGQVRRNVVLYFHDGDRVTLMASHLGLPRHPAWYHNLTANPEVVLGGALFRAEVVEGHAERDRLWALADRIFPPYARYRESAGASGRTIPLVQLVSR